MSGLLSQLHFLRPQWFWALLALPLLAAWWQWQRRRASVWRAHVDPHLLPHLVEGGVSRRGVGGLLARLLAWTLAVAALAGPSWRQGEVPLQQHGRALVVVLDLSDAMLAADLPPSRLLQARAKLATLLRERTGGDVALVAFSDDAYTVAPLTEDSANVAIFLDALAPDVMPVDGHRPDRAIHHAMTLLAQAGYHDGDILLLAHRGDEAAVAAAARARAAGLRVSALGLGRPGGATYRARDGSLRSSRLDAGSLRRVAVAGGGHYAALSTDDGDLAALDVLSPGVGTGAASRSGADARVWRDEGYWLLLPLLLLGLLAFRRGAAFAVLAACLLLPLPEAYAAAPVAGNAWRRADQVEHQRMREGLDAYRAGRHDDAERAWRDLPGADAAYNRGNALAKAGRYEEAIAAYDDALERQPGMEDAIANRALVEAAMRRQPPPGAGQPRQQPGADEDKAGEGEAGGEDSSASQQEGAQPGDGSGDRSDPPPRAPQGDTSRAGEREHTQAPPSSQGEGDAGQRDAYAAQRQRMQQALRQAGTPADDGDTIEGDPDRAETEAERERRQAGEAWLQRVPDDPGGLLRARFRLEYERRNGPGSTP
ncbi:VWA domain-containing protein [Luteimonas viscosa]|uniref:VWA domain-containing protein n=1 Tax=Luteimonas viscosa TaxID=1132694 RepID=A0A5D4XMK3_9GAMM|nr:VWA domain-containing protein [Luteimonas viscosa]TYT25789.1 VWA domain-containing protein [Luteimonas viscosa]